MDCPSIDQLLDYAQRRASVTEADPIGLHLAAGCTACGEVYSTLSRVLEVTAARLIEAPPGWLLQQALKLIDRQKAGDRPGLIDRILGLLVVDSFNEGRLLGVRGGGPSSRHMLYRAGGYEIDLSIDFVEASQSVEIIGQSLPPEGLTTAMTGTAVDLIEGEAVAASTKMNEFGEFILDGIREGTYDLRISFPDLEVDIAALQAVIRPSELRSARS